MYAHAEEANEISYEGGMCGAIARSMFTVSAKARFVYVAGADQNLAPLQYTTGGAHNARESLVSTCCR